MAIRVHSEAQILPRLRRHCLALPEARETVTFGHPTFQAGKKTFAVLETYDGTLNIVFKAAREVQEELCSGGDRYFVAPYVGKHGWTCLRTVGRLEWREIGALVEHSYRLVALKRMLRALDGG